MQQLIQCITTWCGERFLLLCQEVQAKVFNLLKKDTDLKATRKNFPVDIHAHITLKNQ